jgi:DNA-directed RNA polymerase subunit RPC12/RpoP
MAEIKLSCPECGRKLSVSGDKAGKKGKCPRCGAIIEVPSGLVGSPEPESPEEREEVVEVPPQEAKPTPVMARGEREERGATSQEGPARAVKRPTVAWAVASLSCGLLGLLTFWLFFPGLLLGVCAIVFSALQSRRRPHGMATAGLVLGIIAIPLSVFVGGCFGLIALGRAGQAVEEATKQAERARQAAAQVEEARHQSIQPSAPEHGNEADATSPPQDENPAAFLYDNVSFKQGMLGARCLGEITNRSGRDYRTAQFTLSVYSPDGTLAGAFPIFITTFASGQTKSFDENIEVPLENVGKYKIQFDAGF